MAKIIKINNLFVRYFGSDKPVLKGLSLEIEEGEFVLLVGRTGSGKSTLLNVINGVIPNIINATVRGGSINVAGRDPRKMPVHEMAMIVGTVYQIPESQIFSLIVDDDVAFGLENRAVEPEEMRRRVVESLKLVNLLHKMKHPTFLLSGGEKQRLVIAGVLAVRPPRILILDEPTSMLDSIGAEQIFNLVKKLNDEGLTIIMSEHRVERVIGLVDRIIGLRDGTIYIDDEPHRAVAKDLTKLGVEEPQVTTLYRMINKNADYYPISVDEFLEFGAADKLNVVSKHEEDDGEVAISVNNVRFTYPGSTHEVLKGVNLVIHDGDVISVVGPNGSGKSTLMYLLAGIYKPSSGSIQIFNYDSTKLVGKDRVRLIGYVFQDPDQMLFSSTVKSELEFTLKLAGIRGKEAEDRIKRVVNYLGINDLLSQSPHKLSVGQRRLVSVASVLVLSRGF